MMPREFVHVNAPPPATAVTGAATMAALADLRRRDGDEPSTLTTTTTTTTSASSSIIIVIIVISSAIIVSASLYLLLRCATRSFRRRAFSAANEHTFSPSSSSSGDSPRDRCILERQMTSKDLINSLPVFSFGSVTKIAGGDCAVCLSKFEPYNQLRLLPLCCHAFHAECIDAWLSSNQTCPLCRSTVHPTEEDVMNEVLSSENRSDSFRIEIGSLSQRGESSESGDGRRSYSIGSLDYIADDNYEVPVGSTHRREVSCASLEKDSTAAPATVQEAPGGSLEADGTGRSWLRDYVDRLTSISSGTLSFRSSGRHFTGSSRRSESVVPIEDLETNQMGEEISELFRWLSGV
ncbi:E3 ubiquitin-protein ligase ATL4-like [Diospyros lotus]|uniref:E3 ubiquitin-protein ligase ATL4-like n=1 Tax=Diospyros lotus TaxID=55363 RepID=UPI00225A013F|nr:E3 ubiquitin-protein ligase ATL4-like [Diospyros lotus]